MLIKWQENPAGALACVVDRIILAAGGARTQAFLSDWTPFGADGRLIIVCNRLFKQLCTCETCDCFMW